VSDNIDNGGPAFPPHPGSQLQGMSLRDWFAGQALAGWFACSDTVTRSVVPFADAADHAYQAADAMLAERKKGGAA